MSETKVVHCKKEDYDIYIGRPGLYGNPFVIGKHGSRMEVVKKYYEWAKKEMSINPGFKSAILQLEGKVLGCWCRPKVCHGDAIIKLIQEHKEEE